MGRDGLAGRSPCSARNPASAAREDDPPLENACTRRLAEVSALMRCITGCSVLFRVAFEEQKKPCVATLSISSRACCCLSSYGLLCVSMTRMAVAGNILRYSLAYLRIWLVESQLWALRARIITAGIPHPRVHPAEQQDVLHPYISAHARTSAEDPYIWVAGMGGAGALAMADPYVLTQLLELHRRWRGQVVEAFFVWPGHCWRLMRLKVEADDHQHCPRHFLRTGQIIAI